MKRTTLLLALSASLVASAQAGPKGKLLLSDDFERSEKNDAKEEVGNGWGTNSKSRAKGRKQVDLKDGAMHITRADVADHGVSVTHEVGFKDATIQLRFKLRKEDDLGINIADMKEKSVHAGHICMARIRPYRVEITDLKTGRMKQEHREIRQAKKETPELKKLLAAKTKQFKTKIAPGKWHDLEVQITGDQMQVSVDGKKVGSFESAGIGHPTKSRLRLAVGKQAWVDDVKIWGR